MSMEMRQWYIRASRLENLAPFAQHCTERNAPKLAVDGFGIVEHYLQGSLPAPIFTGLHLHGSLSIASAWTQLSLARGDVATI